MDTSTNSQPQPVAPARAFVDVGSITSTDTGTSGTSENVENVPSASPDFKNVKFKDVIVSNEKTNIVSNNFKKTMTQLYSVMGISTVDITNPQMKVIAKGLGIRNSRTFKKNELCEEIVTWVADPLNEFVNAISPKKEVKEVNKHSCTINRRRYLNVIFSDLIRPLLATKGMSLTKGELTEGLKQDQILHTKIAEEYNKDIPEYAGNAFPDIAQGSMINASYYDKIVKLPSLLCQMNMTKFFITGNDPVSMVSFRKKKEQNKEQSHIPKKKKFEFCTRQSIDFIYAQIRGTISGLPLFHYE